MNYMQALQSEVQMR